MRKKNPSAVLDDDCIMGDWYLYVAMHKGLQGCWIIQVVRELRISNLLLKLGSVMAQTRLPEVSSGPLLKMFWDGDERILSATCCSAPLSAQ